MIWWKVNNYLETIKPLLVAGRLFGILPIRNAKEKKLGLMEILILINWLCFFIFILYKNFQKNLFEYISKSSIANNGKRMILICEIVLTVMTMSLTFLVRGKAFKFLKSILSIDSQMKSIGIQVNHVAESKAITMYIVKIIILYSVAIGLSVQLDVCDTLELCFLMNVPLYFINGTFLLFTSQLIIFISSIVYRYRLVNDGIWRFCKINEDYHTAVKLNYRDNRITPILMFAQLHDKLIDGAENISACYAVPLMFGTASIFFFLVITIFAVFRLIFYNDTELYGMTSSLVLWCTYYAIPLVGVIIIGSMLTSEAKHSAVVVHKLINTSRDTSIRYELKIFSQQLIHRVPKISCGLFTFDWTLMYSIVSAITTYLVILIQFDASMNQSRNSTDTST